MWRSGGSVVGQVVINTTQGQERIDVKDPIAASKIPVKGGSRVGVGVGGGVV